MRIDGALQLFLSESNPFLSSFIGLFDFGLEIRDVSNKQVRLSIATRQQTALQVCG